MPVSVVDHEHRFVQAVPMSEQESRSGLHLGGEGLVNDSLRSGSSFGHFYRFLMGFAGFAQRPEGSRGWQRDGPRIKDAKALPITHHSK